MPYMALLGGQIIDALMICDPREWAALKADRGRLRALTLPCCGGSARACTSSRGTHFFAHLPGSSCDEVANDYPEGDRRGESPIHQLLKRAIGQQLISLAGWAAHVERRDPDGAYVADVAAQHCGGRRMAFEVQLSEQPVEVYQRRSERYLQRRILPLWIVSGLPTALTIWRLPHLSLGVTTRTEAAAWSIDDALDLPGTTGQWDDSGSVPMTLRAYVAEMASPKPWPWTCELEQLAPATRSGRMGPARLTAGSEARLDQLNRAGLTDRRPSNDPDRIKALYQRLASASEIYRSPST